MSKMKHSLTEKSTPGEILRYVREASRLSQSEVAQRLCLREQIIDALERDAYNELPAPVFIKGYLRSCADLFHLSASELVRIYEKSYVTSEEPGQLTKTKKTRNMAGEYVSALGYFSLRALNYIVVILLLVLVWLWWHERNQAMTQAISPINLSVERVPFPRNVTQEVVATPTVTVEQQIMQEILPLWNSETFKP